MAQNLFGQGEGTLTRAAAMVAEARADFDRISSVLDGQIQGARSQWGGQGATAFFTLHQTWTQKQQVIVNALNDFEASLTETERFNVSTDDEQASNMTHLTGRLS